eukprot:12368000-Ditylum_brightwellii.AAC.1
MESGCEGHKAPFGVNNFLIVLLGICMELIANTKDILGPSGGGAYAGVCTGGNNQGGMWMKLSSMTMAKCWTT